jgi:hypothetical protein
MSYKTYFDTPEVRVCCTCQSTPILTSCADTRSRRRVTTLSRDWICEPIIHPTWSACPSRRQVNGGRSRFLCAPGVPFSAMPTTKSDYRADGASHANPTRTITCLFFPVSPLSFHVHATPPRVRRCYPAPLLLLYTCTRPYPYPSTAPLSRAFPDPSGRCQRSRADGARALGSHGRALPEHPQQRPAV